MILARGRYSLQNKKRHSLCTVGLFEGRECPYYTRVELGRKEHYPERDVEMTVWIQWFYWEARKFQLALIQWQLRQGIRGSTWLDAPAHSIPHMRHVTKVCMPSTFVSGSLLKNFPRVKPLSYNNAGKTMKEENRARVGSIFYFAFIWFIVKMATTNFYFIL